MDFKFFGEYCFYLFFEGRYFGINWINVGYFLYCRVLKCWMVLYVDLSGGWCWGVFDEVNIIKKCLMFYWI